MFFPCVALRARSGAVLAGQWINPLLAQIFFAIARSDRPERPQKRYGKQLRTTAALSSRRASAHRGPFAHASGSHNIWSSEA
jgi:hypothetical protein